MWRSVVSDLLSVIVPPRCVVCGRVLDQPDEPICPACLVGMPFLSHFGEPSNALARFLLGRIPYEGAAALWRHLPGDVSAGVVYRLKYRGCGELGAWLGRLAASYLQSTPFLSDVDLLVPMPLHPLRYLWRGYNQSVEIARGLSRQTGIPVDSRSVCRSRFTPTQTRLHGEARRRNVAEAFRVRCPERLAGRHLLLVDDVLTTGSTMLSLAETVLQVPGVRVSLLVIGMTPSVGCGMLPDEAGEAVSGG